MLELAGWLVIAAAIVKVARAVPALVAATVVAVSGTVTNCPTRADSEVTAVSSVTI
jgi:hypothetical protein